MGSVRYDTTIRNTCLEYLLCLLQWSSGYDTGGSGSVNLFDFRVGQPYFGTFCFPSSPVIQFFHADEIQLKNT
jgi:hypothetical protein